VQLALSSYSSHPSLSNLWVAHQAVGELFYEIKHRLDVEEFELEELLLPTLVYAMPLYHVVKTALHEEYSQVSTRIACSCSTQFIGDWNWKYDIAWFLHCN
jgi:hypothetical protein